MRRLLNQILWLGIFSLLTSPQALAENEEKITLAAQEKDGFFTISRCEKRNGAEVCTPFKRLTTQSVDGMLQRQRKFVYQTTKNASAIGGKSTGGAAIIGVGLAIWHSAEPACGTTACKAFLKSVGLGVDALGAGVLYAAGKDGYDWFKATQALKAFTELRYSGKTKHVKEALRFFGAQDTGDPEIVTQTISESTTQSTKVITKTLPHEKGTDSAPTNEISVTIEKNGAAVAARK